MAESLGPPQRPESDVSFERVTIPSVEMLDSDLPTCPEELSIKMECKEQENKVCVYIYMGLIFMHKLHMFICKHFKTRNTIFKDSFI